MKDLQLLFWTGGNIGCGRPQSFAPNLLEHLMAISDKDLHVLKAGRECVQRMRGILPAEIGGTASPPIAWALMAICLQHCDSILLLLESGENVASAEALLRPMVESAFRLVWLLKNRERAEQITTGKLNFPSFSRLMRSVAGAAKQPPADLHTATTNLHDLAHAGVFQLTNHFKQMQNRSDPVQAKLAFSLPVVLVIEMAMIACGSFCTITGKQQEHEQIAQLFIVYLCGGLLEVVNAIAPANPLPTAD